MRPCNIYSVSASNKQISKQTKQSSGDLSVVAFFNGNLSIEDGEIQLFPPGEHKISPSIVGQKTRQIEVIVNEAGANAIKASLQVMFEAVKDGSDSEPYIDFDHKDGAAAGWITDVDSIRWAGDDLKTGGIRAKIAYTNSGKEAIQGGDYKKFSPNFTWSPTTKEITGLDGRNIGGLVNKPAFKTIATVQAKEDEDGAKQTTKINKMNKIAAKLLQAGIIGELTENEDVVCSAIDAWHSKTTKGKESAETATSNIIKAKNAEIKTLTDEKAELQVTIKAKEAADIVRAKEHAETVVAKAVEAGTLDAEDKEIQAMWVEDIVANPAKERMLTGIKVSASANQDLGKRFTTSQRGTVTPPASSNPQADVLMEPFVTISAKLMEGNNELTEEMSLIQAAENDPEAYEKYTQGLRIRATA